MKYKLKIEREFLDKNTQKLHEAGSVLTVDEARGKELLAHPQGLVSLVEKIADEIREKAPKVKAKKATDNTDNK